MTWEPIARENVGVDSQQAIATWDNPISPDLSERLGQLTEELGEALQMIGKTVRHGLDSTHPDYGGVTNRANLAKELGQAQAVINIMIQANDLSVDAMNEAMLGKFVKLLKFTHHAVNRALITKWMAAYEQKSREGNKPSTGTNV